MHNEIFIKIMMVSAFLMIIIPVVLRSIVFVIECIVNHSQKKENLLEDVEVKEDDKEWNVLYLSDDEVISIIVNGFDESILDKFIWFETSDGIERLIMQDKVIHIREV